MTSQRKPDLAHIIGQLIFPLLPYQMSRAWARTVAGSKWIWLIVAAALSWVLTPEIPSLDDAYIALHSAQSVLRGHDSSFGSPPLTGITSPAYVALLTVLVWATESPLLALRTQAAAGLLAFAAALWWLAAGITTWKRVLVVIGIVASGLTVLNATNGLETGWSLAVMTGMIAAVRGGRRTLVAIGMGLLPWLRPDLAPMAAVLFAYVLWPASWGDRLRLVGCAALATAPPALWLWAETGQLLPQTIAAKRYWFAEDSAPLVVRISTVSSAIWAFLLGLAPVSMALVWALRSKIGRLGVASIGLTLTAYTFSLPGALWHNDHRYLYPIAVPWLALGLVDAVALWRWNPIILTTALLLPVATWSLRQPDTERVAVDRVAAAREIEMLLPKDSIVLVHDAGALSFYTSHRLVDMVGLKTPSSISLHRDLTWPSGGRRRGEAISEIADASGAHALVTLNEWDGIFGITKGLRDQGWLLTRVRYAAGGYSVFLLERGR